jgi:hypothetical protein
VKNLPGRGPPKSQEPPAKRRAAQQETRAADLHITKKPSDAGGTKASHRGRRAQARLFGIARQLLDPAGRR